jgi:hypothetical protein
MEFSNILLLILGLGALAFYVGRGRSLAVAEPLGGIRHLKALPNYYGLNALLWCALPALAILILWVILDEPIINSLVISGLSEELRPTNTAAHNLLLNKIANLSQGMVSFGGQDAELIAAAEQMAQYKVISGWSLMALCLSLALVGLYFAWRKVGADFNARQGVEQVMEYLLLACACLAIFTTVGIVFSVLFESVQFFRSVPFFDFVFGLEWSPQTCDPRRSGGILGQFWRSAAVYRYPDGIRSGHAGRCTHWTDVRHLFGRVLQYYGAHLCQAGTGSVGGYTHGGLRLLCRAHRSALFEGLRRRFRSFGIVGECAGGRYGDGGDDYSLYFIAGR